VAQVELIPAEKVSYEVLKSKLILKMNDSTKIEIKEETPERDSESSDGDTCTMSRADLVTKYIDHLDIISKMSLTITNLKSVNS